MKDSLGLKGTKWHIRNWLESASRTATFIKNKYFTIEYPNHILKKYDKHTKVDCPLSSSAV